MTTATVPRRHGTGVLNNGRQDARTGGHVIAGAPDGGWGWVVVAAAFLVYFVTDGVVCSFAVFYVDLLDEFTSASHARVLLVGTMMPAVCLFVGPVAGGLTNKYGCRAVAITGSVLAASGLALSAFSQHINMLIATYGLLTGIGLGMMRLPSVVIVSCYFARRRALATSLVLCGIGLGEFIFPPLTLSLIEYYGWRGANGILAAVLLHGTVCGCLFRPPPPPSAADAGPAGCPGEAAAARPSCAVMERIIAEKRRRQRESTGSLDGTLITSDGRVLRHQSPRSSSSSLPRPRTVSDPLTTASDHELVREQSSSASEHSDNQIASSDRPATVFVTQEQPTSSSVVCNREQSSSDRLEPVLEVREQSELLSKPLNIDCRGQSDPVEVVQDQSGQNSESSDSSTVVWVLDSVTAAPWHACGTELGQVVRSPSERSSEVEITVQLHTQRPSASLMTSHAPAVTSSQLLSARPDIFYTGSYLQIHSDTSSAQRGGSSVTSSGDRKWSASTAHAHDGPVWSMLRVMLDVSLLQRVAFVVLAVSVLLCYFGLLTPFTVIVDHVVQLGLHPSKAATLLSVLGLSSTVSRLLVGWLTDKSWVDSVVFYTVALLVAGSGTCSLPLLRSYQLLCFYQVLYGSCSAVFVTLKSILVVDLLGLDKLTTAYGILCLIEGVGSLAGSPLLGGLYDVTGSYSMSFVVAGSLLVIAGVVCVPLRHVERWEQSRYKRRRRTAWRHRPLVNVVRNAI